MRLFPASFLGWGLQVTARVVFFFQLVGRSAIPLLVALLLVNLYLQFDQRLLVGVSDGSLLRQPLTSLVTALVALPYLLVSGLAELATRRVIQAARIVILLVDLLDVRQAGLVAHLASTMHLLARCRVVDGFRALVRR